MPYKVIRLFGIYFDHYWSEPCRVPGLALCHSNFCSIYVTVPEKTDHFAQISDIEILVPRSSALFTLRNSESQLQ